MTAVRSFAFAVLCLLPPSSAAAQGDAAEETVEAVVERAFRPLLAAHDVPGIAVAVTVDGRQRFFNFGVTSPDGEEAVGENTLFEIGSISKVFTATLASYAEAEGRLSLADHPSRFVPELRGSAADRASLVELGTYTAGGLPLQFPDGVRNGRQAIGYLAKWKPDAAPGDVRRYSNPSIGLFGHAAARAMGGDFAALVEREIFPKLGLEDSYIRVPDEAKARYAFGTNRAGKPVRVTPGALDAEAYGVKSTSTDMIRFVEANIHPDALDEPMRRAVQGTHIGYFRVGETVQGLGWEQYPWPVSLDRLLAGNSTEMAMRPHEAERLAPPRSPTGPTLFNKTGSTGGFGAYVAFVPARRIGIVMLANRSLPNAARITAAHAVLERLAREAP